MITLRSVFVTMVTAVLSTCGVAAQSIDTAQLSERFSADMRQQLEQYTRTKNLRYGPWVVHQLGAALFTRDLTSGSKRWVAMFYGTLTNDADQGRWSVDDLSIFTVRDLPSAAPVTFTVDPVCAPREWTCVRTITCGKQVSFVASAQWHTGRYDAAIDRIVVQGPKPTDPITMIADDGSTWSTPRRDGDSLWYVGHAIRYRPGVKGAKDVLVVGTRGIEIDAASIVRPLMMIPEDVTAQRPSGDVLVRSGTSVRLVGPKHDATLTMPANAIDMDIEVAREQGAHRCYHLLPQGALKRRLAWCISTKTMKANKGRCQHD